jgi:3-hydroxybutyrate dehydrogenase
MEIDGDITERVSAQAVVEAAIDKWGGIDILVNNAGIQHVARVENFPPDKWDAIIAINLSASFHTIRAALPAMKRKGWGRIINIASTHGLVASSHKVAYVAAKHGLIELHLRLLIGEKQPQVQFTTAEQIAGLAVFLASDTASNMQGTALVSDGGWTAQ